MGVVVEWSEGAMIPASRLAGEPLHNRIARERGY